MDPAMAATLCSKLDRIEGLLAEIEVNGRGDDYEEKQVQRQDIDGKQVLVHVRINVIQVGDINNVSQEFKAELYIAARYLEPALQGVTCEDDINWVEQWDPRIAFPNLVTQDKLTKKVYLGVNNDGSGVPMVVRSFRLIGTFKETLELEDFPMDAQELNVVLTSDWPDKDVKFVKDMLIKDSINISNFSDSQTWDLLNHVIARPVELAKDESGSHRKYPVYMLTFHVQRKIGYYFWNIVFVTGIIMFLTFASFAVKATDTGDRLSVTVTLLLTSVAFKFVVSQNLPTISYLTVLDVYVLMCMVFQCLIAVQNSVSSVWADETQTEQARTFDMISAIVLISSVLIFHVIMAIVIIVKVRRRNKLLHDAKRSYEELVTQINEDYQRRKRRAKSRHLPCDETHLNYDRSQDHTGHSRSFGDLRRLLQSKDSDGMNEDQKGDPLIRKNAVGAN